MRGADPGRQAGRGAARSAARCPAAQALTSVLLALSQVEGAAGAPGLALATAVPGLAADGALALLSQGPTVGEAPLVGSIPALIFQGEAAAGARGPLGSSAPKPSVHGQAAAQQAAEAPAAQRPIFFGAAASEGQAYQRCPHPAAAAAGMPAGFGGRAAATPLAAAAGEVGGTPLLGQRDFDRVVLGVQGSPASATRGKRRRPVLGAFAFKQ